MAAPLPPDMENKTQRLSRRLSSLSVGAMGFILGTAFGVAFSSMITSVVSGLVVFLAVAGIIALYWYLAKGKADKSTKDK
jgi:predicted Na+-dependent transporter